MHFSAKPEISEEAKRKIEVWRGAYSYDGSVIDEEHVLNGHGRHLGYEDAPQRIDNGWVCVDEIELHVPVLYPVHHHLKPSQTQTCVVVRRFLVEGRRGRVRITYLTRDTNID